jgi:hypothetical protein
VVLVLAGIGCFVVGGRITKSMNKETAAK